jgi:Flp pilus assembly protein TadD
VFVLLAIAIAGGLVVFGVGAGGVGFGELFKNNSGGGSGTPSISEALKETQTHPKNPQAWSDLGQAYELKGQTNNAIDAWTTYTKLRPSNVGGYARLAALYSARSTTETNDATTASYQAQDAAGSAILPPSTSPLGQALASQPNQVTQAASQSANSRYNEALTARQKTLTALVGVYGSLARLQPADAATRLQLAFSAQNAGDNKTALSSYREFLKLAPDDANARYARQQIKTLQAQLKSSPQG